MKVHPIADMFPMLDGEGLLALAEDIKARGQIAPIVVDRDGQLLDGRNRLRACELAGVEPRFETYEGDDPDGYVVATNLRRDLNQSQRAIIAAKSSKLEDLRNHGRGGAAGKLAQTWGVAPSRISEAVLVLEFRPDLAELMAAGNLPLHRAYADAQEEKARREKQDRLVDEMRDAAPDLARLVEADDLTLEAALDQFAQRKRDQEEKDAAAADARATWLRGLNNVIDWCQTYVASVGDDYLRWYLQDQKIAGVADAMRALERIKGVNDGAE